jgi:DNA-binding NarL/FixJ family response regulator
LTQRELEIAVLICNGEKSIAIANRLGISEHTVKTHRRAIYNKLRIHTAAELAIVMSNSPTGAAALHRR